ncbi:hypothetical protein OVA14_04345 [Agrococcus sp. SL85]|uniref:hypothetical protein n=1 Tax=Agrococcus sp. SL85 TaxID=2995141 RepID=UPI00226CE89F|nr:hypothetical protein [Agrococcus sp. SL85]WAC66998.1 hypothetical protein OVA14_04345 [Agrococcus sp. SL85]
MQLPLHPEPLFHVKRLELAVRAAHGGVLRKRWRAASDDESFRRPSASDGARGASSDCDPDASIDVSG